MRVHVPSGLRTWRRARIACRGKPSLRILMAEQGGKMSRPILTLRIHCLFQLYYHVLSWIDHVR